MDNQKFLIKIVNEQFGIMGTCFKVSTILWLILTRKKLKKALS
jgi:hypothetical protein